MPKKTCVRTQRCNVAYSDAHNTRVKALGYVDKERTKYNEGEFFDPRTLPTIVADIAKKVKANTGRKLQKNAAPIREEVIVCNEDTTLDQLKAYVSEHTKRFGTTPLRLFIHRDEGHEATPQDIEDGKAEQVGEWIGNFHAHFVYSIYGEATKWRNGKLGRGACRTLQDMAAKHLGMERGLSSDVKHLTAQQFKATKAEERAKKAEQREAKAKEGAEKVAVSFARLKTATNRATEAAVDSKAKLSEAKSALAGKVAVWFNKDKDVNQLKAERDEAKAEATKWRSSAEELRRERGEVAKALGFPSNCVDLPQNARKMVGEYNSTLEEKDARISDLEEKIGNMQKWAKGVKSLLSEIQANRVPKEIVDKEKREEKEVGRQTGRKEFTEWAVAFVREVERMGIRFKDGLAAALSKLGEWVPFMTIRNPNNGQVVNFNEDGEDGLPFAKMSEGQPMEFHYGRWLSEYRFFLEVGEGEETSRGKDLESYGQIWQGRR